MSRGGGGAVGAVGREFALAGWRGEHDPSPASASAHEQNPVSLPTALPAAPPPPGCSAGLPAFWWTASASARTARTEQPAMPPPRYCHRTVSSWSVRPLVGWL